MRPDVQLGTPKREPQTPDPTISSASGAGVVQRKGEKWRAIVTTDKEQNIRFAARRRQARRKCGRDSFLKGRVLFFAVLVFDEPLNDYRHYRPAAAHFSFMKRRPWA
jgi:hypothetical protein